MIRYVFHPEAHVDLDEIWEFGRVFSALSASRR